MAYPLNLMRKFSDASKVYAELHLQMYLFYRTPKEDIEFPFICVNLRKIINNYRKIPLEIREMWVNKQRLSELEKEIEEKLK